ncbi:MAG: hypothetical protein ACJATI_004539 [Halioglobus sp.]|jgi:ATP synthase protein I
MKVKPKPDENKKTKNLMKYTGLGFQMAGIFFLGIFGGQKLDEYFELETHYFTIGLILFLFTGYLYKLYIDLTKDL